MVSESLLFVSERLLYVSLEDILLMCWCSMFEAYHVVVGYADPVLYKSSDFEKCEF